MAAYFLWILICFVYKYTPSYAISCDNPAAVAARQLSDGFPLVLFRASMLQWRGAQPVLLVPVLRSAGLSYDQVVSPDACFQPVLYAVISAPPDPRVSGSDLRAPTHWPPVLTGCASDLSNTMNFTDQVIDNAFTGYGSKVRAVYEVRAVPGAHLLQSQAGCSLTHWRWRGTGWVKHTSTISAYCGPVALDMQDMPDKPYNYDWLQIILPAEDLATRVHVHAVSAAAQQQPDSVELLPSAVDLAHGSWQAGIWELQSSTSYWHQRWATDVEPVLGAAMLAAGAQHTCGLFSGGALACWGNGADNRLGRGLDTSSMSAPGAASIDADGRAALHVAAGDTHSCAVFQDGTAACWGDGSLGKLGSGSTTSVPAPGVSSIDASTRSFVRISAGPSHTCATFSDGSAACWGGGAQGQLGLGSRSSVAAPLAASINAGGRLFSSISAGTRHSCAVFRDGTAACWGEATQSKLGATYMDDVLEPAGTSLDSASGSTYLSISAGVQHTCAVLSSEQAACWGRGAEHQLGTGSAAQVDSPPGGLVQCPAGEQFIAVHAGDQHTCGILGSGQVACWGSGADGWLGLGGVSQASIAEAWTYIVQPAVSMSVSATRTCVLFADGAGGCVGAGAHGALGYGSTASLSSFQMDTAFPMASTGSSGNGLVSTAMLAGSAPHFPALSSKFSTTCVLRLDGSVSCVGDNSYGQCGVQSSPNPVLDVAVLVDMGGRAAVRISSGQSHTCAVFVDNTAVCWGSNQYGQQGMGDTKTRAVPGTGAIDTQSRPVASVEAGGLHTCLLFADSTSTCFGSNSYGQVGRQSDDPYYQRCTSAGPALDTGGRSVAKLSLGNQHSCAIFSDMSATCWGDGYGHKLGTGSTASVGKPGALRIDVGGRNFTSISAGYAHTCAAFTDGTAICWGQNTNGRLGTGASVQVPGSLAINLAGRFVLQIAAGSLHSCAVMRNGDAMCWGEGGDGALGSGATSNIPVPAQLTIQQGTAEVRAVEAGGRQSCFQFSDGTWACTGSPNDGRLGIGDVTRLAPTAPIPGVAARPVQSTALLPSSADLYMLHSGITTVRLSGAPVHNRPIVVRAQCGTSIVVANISTPTADAVSSSTTQHSCSLHRLSGVFLMQRSELGCVLAGTAWPVLPGMGPAPSLFSAMLQVHVWTTASTAASDILDSLFLPGAPSVLQAFTELPNTRPTRLVLAGGIEAAFVRGAAVATDAHVCRNLTWLASNVLTCVMPPHEDTAVEVRAEAMFQGRPLRLPLGVLQYQTPSIESVKVVGICAGPAMQAGTVECQELAELPQDISSENLIAPSGGTVLRIGMASFTASSCFGGSPESPAPPSCAVDVRGQPCWLLNPGASQGLSQAGGLLCLAPAWNASWGSVAQAPRQPLRINLTDAGLASTTLVQYGVPKLTQVQLDDVQVLYRDYGGALRNMTAAQAGKQVFVRAESSAQATAWISLRGTAQYLPSQAGNRQLRLLSQYGELVAACEEHASAPVRGAVIPASSVPSAIRSSAALAPLYPHVRITCTSIPLGGIPLGALQLQARSSESSADLKFDDQLTLPLSITSLPIIESVKMWSSAGMTQQLHALPHQGAWLQLQVKGLVQPLPTAQQGLAVAMQHRMPALLGIDISNGTASVPCAFSVARDVRWAVNAAPAAVNCTVPAGFPAGTLLQLKLVMAGGAAGLPYQLPTFANPTIERVGMHVNGHLQWVSSLPVSGGIVVLDGRNIAPTGQASDVTMVRVGSLLCTDVSVVQIDQVTCRVPPGRFSAEVQLVAGAQVATYALARDVPKITQVEPAAIAPWYWDHTGAAAQQPRALVTFRADNGFGGQRTDWHVYLGGVACPVDAVTTVTLSCWLDRRALGRNGTLAMRVCNGDAKSCAGSSSSDAILAQGLQLRTAARVALSAQSDLQFAEGQLLVITGSGFGLQVSASRTVHTVQAARWHGAPVTIANVTESSISLRSPDLSNITGPSVVVFEIEGGQQVPGPIVTPPAVHGKPSYLRLERTAGQPATGVLYANWKSAGLLPTTLQLSIWPVASPGRGLADSLPPSHATNILVKLAEAISPAGARVVGITTPYPVLYAARGTRDGAVGEFLLADEPAVPVCGAGSFLPSHAPLYAQSCEPCPLGRNCSRPGLTSATIGTLAGYAVPPWLSAEQGAAAAACPSAAICEAVPARSANDTGAGSASSGNCVAGHTGVLCASCSPGWFASASGACQACTGGAAGSIVFLALACLGLLAALAWMIQNEVLSNDFAVDDTAVLKKVLINHGQLIGMCVDLSVLWPQPALGWLQFSDAASSMGQLFVSPECIGATSGQQGNDGVPLPMWRALLIALLPAVTLLLLALVAAAVTYHRRIRWSWARLQLWGVAALVSTLYLLYIPATRAALSMFACREIAPGKDSKMMWDLDWSVPCDAPVMQTWRAGLATPVLLVVTCGFPLATALYLWLNRHELAERVAPGSGASAGALSASTSSSTTRRLTAVRSPRWIALRRSTGLLWTGYRGQVAPWYEVLVLARKVAISAAVTIAAPLGVQTQVYIAAMVLLPAYVLQMRLRPYKHMRHNALEEVHMGTALVTLITAPFIADAGSATASAQTAAVIVLLVNLMFGGVWSHQAVRLARSEWAKHKHTVKAFSKQVKQVSTSAAEKIRARLGDAQCKPDAQGVIWSRANANPLRAGQRSPPARPPVAAAASPPPSQAPSGNDSATASRRSRTISMSHVTQMISSGTLAINPLYTAQAGDGAGRRGSSSSSDLFE